MKKMTQILTTLAGLFAPKSVPNRTNAAPVSIPATDDIEFCKHPRHGAFPVRRTFKASGVSAHGYSFSVFQCPSPGCGEFVARTINPSTGQERILFRGKFFSPRRETPQPAPLRHIRAGHAAA